MSKILYVLQDSEFSGNTNQFGGKIAHVIGVVEEFQRLGNDILIACFDPVPSLSGPAVDYLFFQTPPLRFPGTGLYRQWHVVTQLISWIEEHSPDLLYIRWMQNIYFDRVRRRFPDLPIVIECNTPLQMGLAGNAPSLYRRWLAARSDRSLVHSASVISAVSSDVREFLLSHHSSLKACDIIDNPNGVDTERFACRASSVRGELGIDESAVLIGFAGNIRRWHRVDILIGAFQALDAENACLVIMGAGPPDLEADLRSTAEKHRGAQIIFPGSIPYDRMPEYLCSCDILVAPHGKFSGDKFHGSPVKLFEYMAVGRAVVASRIGQLFEIVKDGRNGMLFEPESMGELRTVLQRLISEPELRERIGRAARVDAREKYSWAANVRRILDALENQKASGTPVGCNH